MEQQAPRRVVIGMDPHERSVTIEVMRPEEAIVVTVTALRTRDGATVAVPLV